MRWHSALAEISCGVTNWLTGKDAAYQVTER